MSNNVMNYLFETNAFKIAPENKPFWYTSGKIGPFFINAQFLYGSENDSKELLDFIDSELENTPKENIPKNIFEKVFNQYTNNSIFFEVINELKKYLEANINIYEIDYVSGGERRDWYFSNILAHLLNKPHITIFKDLSMVKSSPDFAESTKEFSLQDKQVLHVADLLNQASSYIRAWIPAIEEKGGKIAWSAVMVDRLQGGTEKLEDAGIKSFSLLNIDNTLFEKALELGIINEAQLEMLKSFKQDPDGSMRQFLIDNPNFLQDALNSDEKSAKRAKLCIDSNIYNL